jgi:hypothetical protein
MIHPLELTVMSCLHMVRAVPPEMLNPALGSGVIVIYKKRFFLCSVEHFTNHPGQTTAIETGLVINGHTMLITLPENGYSYLEKIVFEDMPDAEDLEYIFEHGGTGRYLDFAVKEVSLLNNIKQNERTFEFGGDIGTIVVHEGGKAMIPVDDRIEIDKGQACSFYGRIRPNMEGGVLQFHEHLYAGLEIVDIGEYFIKLDLGGQIRDHARFRGCSGAPVIDTRNQIVGLVSYGESEVKEPYIYAFRFDKVIQFIELAYFQLEQLPPAPSS